MTSTFTKHARPTFPWPEAAAEFVLSLSTGDLPPAPWEFAPGRTITQNEIWLNNLQTEIRVGPSSPAAIYGALQHDIQHLAGMFQRFRDLQSSTAASPPSATATSSSSSPALPAVTTDPPAHRCSSTSQAAARSIRPHRQGQQKAIVDYLQAHGDGTREEIAQATGIAEKSVCPRITELRKAGVVRKTSRTRPSSSGRDVEVLELTTNQPALF